eukprot:987756-Prymnesium_polylepis.1
MPAARPRAPPPARDEFALASPATRAAIPQPHALHRPGASARSSTTPCTLQPCTPAPTIPPSG